MKQKIMDQLKHFELEHEVTICYAAESGSRAWGFASVNSDYDVRFIYKRNVSAYLTLDPPRDVIEIPIHQDLDFHGWDLFKALRLFQSSNATLLEWLSSPTIYREEGDIAEQLRKLASDHFSIRRTSFHYLHLAKGHDLRQVNQKEQVKIKAYLYLLRSLFCLNWIEQNQSPPPTLVWSLLDGMDVDPWIKDRFHQLVDLKKESDELGLIGADRELNTLIHRELSRYEEKIPSLPDRKLESTLLNRLIWEELA
ncbi:putative nucleotidyltransferase [Croceifilum oryzae]|uniref:Nucleotidyltransferase n=1 Tax=Croceifilum oryzae TaxID=1553429 RepID=A0AAJ1WPC2_9BACL|nr:nucleotidyltransferase domain-containing protein [Croceifilum oryzae]MDQ0416397.1 putative nucleotidyltransferase [Croceifilum oryzae]